ncbi:Rieske (2Fe-2S) protein [Mariprofundus ferrooxydans]|uniref:Rieske (2Fe-2S) protein n=1 Tax=Mariprofundus ferrooxydans TaxID=314344 RepID=UPI00036D72AA|nr:Rieske 2Fe-2S domain-containing protein [Mariprofundus ferrooxydans]
MIARDKWIKACAGSKLGEKSHLSMDVHFSGELIAVVVIRFNSLIYAYRNQCVHMVRRLDGENGRVFDKNGLLLRCSMHGVVYQPETGESLSTLCHGEKLSPIKVIEQDGDIYFADKRVKGIKRGNYTMPG